MNRLAREKSPYLLQHAGNPVDWYPWGAEAFAAARARDVPVFLSVGYAACHWCHVMERESFTDAAVSRLLNEHFVAVKVDREELPHVDHLYMTFCQAMTGGGGWPLTVVMTGEGRPFFAGTYFPRETGHGRVGMLELLPQLARLWCERREDVLKTADALHRTLAAQVNLPAGEPPGPELLADAYGELFRIYDSTYGGFGRAPKFPGAPWLLFLLRYGKRGGDGRARLMAEESLRALRLGGIFDQLGFGFHRYATDRGWLVPHFEKMLYDQALLAEVYIEAFLIAGDPAFRRVAEEIFAYVLRDLRGPEGGFAAAEDADSDGEEGAFYLWTTDEVAAVLGPAAEEFAGAFHLMPNGNFRGETGEFTGRNIPHRLSPLAVSAADFLLAAEGLPPSLETSRQKLFAARERRVRPLRDDKVLTDWNGLMIGALARGAAAFGEPRYAEEAARAADFLLTRLRDPDGRLLHRYRDGEAAFPANLDDCAFLARGLLELHGATAEARWLNEARRLTDEMLHRYGDHGEGGFFFAPADEDPPLPLRHKIAADASLPAGNAIAAEVLLRLARLTGEIAYAKRAGQVLRALSGELARSPLACAQLLCVLMMLEEGAPA